MKHIIPSKVQSRQGGTGQILFFNLNQSFQFFMGFCKTVRYSVEYLTVLLLFSAAFQKSGSQKDKSCDTSGQQNQKI